MAWKDGRVGAASREATVAVAEWMAKAGAMPAEGFEDRNPGALGAWRFRLPVLEKEVEVELWLPAGFPWQAPKVALVEVPAFPSLPHVEPDGELCLLAGPTEWVTTDPVGLVEDQILAAKELLTKGLSGENEDDFRSEALSYWRSDKGRRPVKALLDRGGPSRLIYLWEGKTFAVVGDDPEAVQDWIKHRFPGMRRKLRLVRGMLCWLDAPPLPNELPSSASELEDLLRKSGLSDDLPEVVMGAPDGVVVVFGFPTPQGASYLATTVFPSRSGWSSRYPNREWLTRGFRPGTPAAQKPAATRFTNRAHLARRQVERVDADWVHGRDTNADVEALRTSTVALVGCGSLGSAVARLLAQAGVGGFTLVDGESLTAANTGRHLLGASSVGLKKARELGRRIELDYPHVFDVTVAEYEWQIAAEARPSVFDVDLVISTVGSWTTESMLDFWLQDRKQRVVYGWVEPEAAGGQALLLDHSQAVGCLACGMSKKGVPHLKITDWMARTLVQEPACGAFFQPYGALQLERGAIAVSELALDALLDRAEPSEHRLWSGSASNLERAGGAWTRQWADLTGEEPAERGVSRRWPKVDGCHLCGRE